MTEATKLLSEVSQTMTNIIISLFCGIKKNDTNELIYKIETLTDTKNKLTGVPWWHSR